MSRRALGLLLASNFLGGSSYLVIGYALRDLSPVQLAFWRFAIAAVCFLPFAVRGLRERRPSARDWLGILGVAWLGLAAPQVIGAIGQRLSTATNASLLVGIEPLSVLVLSAVFLGEDFSFIKGSAVALGIAGSSLIVLQNAPWAAHLAPHWRGDLLLAFHAFLWALYTVIGKPVLKKVEPMLFCALTTLLALPVTAAFALKEGGLGAPTAALGPLLYLAIGVTVLGVVTWNMALEEVPASQLANLIFLQPLIGVVLGVAVQGDPFTRWSALGGAAILGGVYLAAREPSAVPAPETAAAPVETPEPVLQ